MHTAAVTRAAWRACRSCAATAAPVVRLTAPPLTSSRNASTRLMRPRAAAPVAIPAIGSCQDDALDVWGRHRRGFGGKARESEQSALDTTLSAARAARSLLLRAAPGADTSDFTSDEESQLAYVAAHPQWVHHSVTRAMVRHGDFKLPIVAPDEASGGSVDEASPLVFSIKVGSSPDAEADGTATESPAIPLFSSGATLEIGAAKLPRTGETKVMAAGIDGIALAKDVLPALPDDCVVVLDAFADEDDDRSTVLSKDMLDRARECAESFMAEASIRFMLRLDAGDDAAAAAVTSGYERVAPYLPLPPQEALDASASSGDVRTVSDPRQWPPMRRAVVDAEYTIMSWAAGARGAPTDSAVKLVTTGDLSDIEAGDIDEQLSDAVLVFSSDEEATHFMINNAEALGIKAADDMPTLRRLPGLDVWARVHDVGAGAVLDYRVGGGGSDAGGSARDPLLKGADGLGITATARFLRGPVLFAMSDDEATGRA